MMELDNLLPVIVLSMLALVSLGFFLVRQGRKAPPLGKGRGQGLGGDTEEGSITQKALRAKPRGNLITLEEALSKTREGFWGRLKSQFHGKEAMSSSEMEELEEALYMGDLGPQTVNYLLNRLSTRLTQGTMDLHQLQMALREELKVIFAETQNKEPLLGASGPSQTGGGTAVWMVVGVNGAGKTTTIGKLAHQQASQGKRVLIAAGDRFRAAADQQLQVWANRAEVEIFNPEGLKDPSAVAFEAVKKGAAFDLVLVDTAGRLHTQKNLMEELKKTKRVMAKAMPEAPQETLLVLDANSGQNALIQTEQFHGALGVTGVILTKMDGSAKGGVAVGIAWEHKLPLKMIGVGEKIQDLRPFEAEAFVNSIL